MLISLKDKIFQIQKAHSFDEKRKLVEELTKMTEKLGNKTKDIMTAIETLGDVVAQTVVGPNTLADAEKYLQVNRNIIKIKGSLG